MANERTEEGERRNDQQPDRQASPDQLFGSIGAGHNTPPATGFAGQLTWVPTVEVLERDGQLIVRTEVPGLTKDQVNVEVVDRQLVISGSFHRAIPLPERANPEQAKAIFANGVLEITMPETAPPKGRRVEVQDQSQAKQTQKQESHAA
jgi:HSP20 family protein